MFKIAVQDLDESLTQSELLTLLILQTAGRKKSHIHMKRKCFKVLQGITFFSVIFLMLELCVLFE